jgi:putative tryptophan/tyrosine transport system substrate-binding protein
MKGHIMHRRDFITLLGGAAASWPVAAGAQQGDRMRRVGVMMAYAEDDPEAKPRITGFRLGLERLGWSEGRNVRFEHRLGATGPQAPELAKELIGLQPDVILAQGPIATAALQRESRTIPIVSVGVNDLIGAGFIASLARPGGNITGLALYEEGIIGKWLQMLKEIAPHVSRAALMTAPVNTFVHYLSAATAISSSLAIELVLTHVESAADIEHTIESFARVPGGALVLPSDSRTNVHRELIIALADRHRLPAVSSERLFVKAGGLMSYGSDIVDQYRQAAAYVSRILRGDKPADLPVQAPVKYETVLNLKTARALGLTVPDLMLVRADEVIE